MTTPAEIKRALRDAGAEVYRTRGDVVHIAERVRENLLMDSGIFVDAQGPKVGFVVRAQRTDFPGVPEDQLFERARRLGEAALSRGFRETESALREVRDPGDGERTIDTWYEVQFEKPVESIDAAISEIRFALTLHRSAGPQ
ncbi:hypothetical protein [Chondromyces crocatus]|uniref:Uncharacterized protein n=1 Tax=Chondromyces crocatus TaxID=52 RepID=A0A0K1ELA0_CHOCO|nr:hypothetical protein [Chondromyces crocatus]AKT41393.1 uncharacterized protein CMC5_055930 [Chondromyces crocatus]